MSRYVEGEETRSVPVSPRGFGNAAQKSCRGIEVAYKVSLKTRCTRIRSEERRKIEERGELACSLEARFSKCE